MMKLVVLGTMMTVAFGATVPVGVVEQTGGRSARLLTYDSIILPDSYAYAFESDDGISVQAQGVLQPGQGTESPSISAQGGFGYKSPEGETVAITYVADETGFHPSGDVIPTSPPIPSHISRALAYIQAHPQAAESVNTRR